MPTYINIMFFCTCYSFLLYGISAATETKNLLIVKKVFSDSVQVSLKGFVLPPNTTSFNISLYKLKCKDLRLCKLNETRIDSLEEVIEWKGLSPNTMYKVIVVFFTKIDFQTYTASEEFVTKSKQKRPWTSYSVNRQTASHFTRTLKNKNNSAVTSTGFTSFSTETSTIGTDKHTNVEKQWNRALKGLIWWVSVVCGAGLSLIILLSILTVLFHMTWRRHKLVQLHPHTKKAEDNMYRAIKATEPSNKITELQARNGKCGEISEKECVNNDRYQKTQSAVSWGTDFDTQDTNQDEAYANTEFLFTQSN